MANTRVGALIVLMLLASAIFAQTQPSATDRTIISMATTQVSDQAQAYTVTVHAYTISETYYRQIDDLPTLQNQLDQLLNDGYTDPASIADEYDIKLNNLARSPVYFYVDDKPAPNCPDAVLTDDSGMASCVVSMDPAVTGKEYCLPVKVEFRGSAGAKPATTFTTLCPDNPKPIKGVGDAISEELAKPQSALACLPLVLVLGFLISAMYFSGKNPLGLFDITTPRLPQPKIMKMGKTSFFAEWKIMNRELALQQAAYKLAMGQTLANLAKQMGNSGWKGLFDKAVEKKDIAALKKLAAEISSAAKTREQIEGAALFRKSSDQYVWSLATQNALTELNAPPKKLLGMNFRDSWFDKKVLKRMGFVRGAVGNVTYNMRIVGGVGKALAVETKAAHGLRNLVGLVSANGAANVQKFIDRNAADKKTVTNLADPVRMMEKQKKDLEKVAYEELMRGLLESAKKGSKASGKEGEIELKFSTAILRNMERQGAITDKLLKETDPAKITALNRNFNLSYAALMKDLAVIASSYGAKNLSGITDAVRDINNIATRTGSIPGTLNALLQRLTKEADAKKGEFAFLAGGRDTKDLPMFAMIKDLEANIRQMKPKPGETKEQMMGRLTKELRESSEKRTGALVMQEYMRQLEIAKAEGRTRKEDLAKIDLRKVEAYVRLTMLAENYSMAFPLADKREGKAYSKFAAEAAKVIESKFGVKISPEKLQAQLSPDGLREIKDTKGNFIFSGIDTSYAWKTGDRDLRRGIDAYVQGMKNYGVKSREVSFELASAMLYANRLQGRLDEHAADCYGKQLGYNISRQTNMLAEYGRRFGFKVDTQKGLDDLGARIAKGLTYSDMKKGVWVTSVDGTATPYFTQDAAGKKLAAREMMRVSEFDKVINGMMLYQDSNGKWSRYNDKKHGQDMDKLFDDGRLQIVTKDTYGKAWSESANPLWAWGAKQYRGVAGFFERVTYGGFADTAQKYKDFMNASSINHTTYWNLRQDMQLGKFDKFLGHTSGGLSPVAKFIGEKSDIGETANINFNLPSGTAFTGLQRDVARYGQSAAPYWYTYKDIITRDPRIGSTAYGMQAMFPGLYMYGQGVMSSPKGYEGGVGSRYYGFKETFVDGFKQGIKPGGNWTTFNAGISNIMQKSRALMIPSYHASALATSLIRTPEMLIMGWPAHYDEHESTKGRYVEAAKSIFRPWGLHDMADSWKIPKWSGAITGSSFSGAPTLRSPTKWWEFGYGGTEEHNISSGKLKGGTFFTDMPGIGKGLQRALGTGWHVQRGASGQEYYDDGMVKRYEDYNAYYKGVPYAHTGLNVSGTVYTNFYGSPAVMPRVWLEAASSGKLKDALGASSDEFQKKAGYEAYADKVRRDETAPTAIHQLYSRESQFTQFNLMNFPTSMALLPPLVPYIVGKSVLRQYQANKHEFEALKAEKPDYTHLQHTMDKVADTYRAMSYKPQDTVYCPRGHVMKRGMSCPICGSSVKDTFRK